MAQVNLGKVWGSTGIIEDTGDAKYLQGWIVEIPSYQEFNFVLNSMDGNILHLATEGVFNYQNDITYSCGAEVRDDDTHLHYWSLAENNVGNLVSDINYWAKVPSYGVDQTTVFAIEGMKLEQIHPKTSNLWTSSDLTIENSSSIIHLKTTTAHDNWLLSNVRGKVVLTNTHNIVLPDGRDLVQDLETYEIFHEGNIPTIDNVGGVGPAPLDNKYYVRQNNNWVEVIFDEGVW